MSTETTGANAEATIGADVDPFADDADWEEEVEEEPLVLQGERRLVTQPYDYSIQQLVDEIARKKILLDIEYQRKYVWDDGKASRLIESLLLNVPIPVCYFAEDDDFNFEVIDGLQRITSLKRYLADEFPLTGITVLAEIAGKKFSELTPRDQRRLANRTIRCVAITSDSHPDIKFDVFERLNSNVAVLTAQEIRNCVYRGDFNTSIKSFAATSELRSLIGAGSARRMVTEELVLRFLALYTGLSTYRPPLRQFLNAYMRQRKSVPMNAEEERLVADCVNTALEVFGTSAFQVPDRAGAVHSTVNKALFDAVMISIAYSDRALIRSRATDLSSLIGDILKDEDFRMSLGRATADRKRVYGRIRRVSEELAARGFPAGALKLMDDEGS
jgi:hypothetical protein